MSGRDAHSAHPLKPIVSWHETGEAGKRLPAWLDGGLRCRAERRGVSRCCGCTNGVGLNTTRGRSITFAARPTAGLIPISQLPPPPPPPPPPENPCGVSAVYGDRRRHLPSSLALPLRSASLGYERRDFLPDENAIPDSRATFSLASPFAPGSRFNV